MKIIICAAICIILIVSLCGCSTITEGEVYEKEYREAHTQIMMLPLNISNGKTSSTIMVPYLIRYPERYVVFIKAYQDGKWVTEDFYVSKEVYDATSIGDMFLYDKDRGDLQEEPYTKERKQN